MPANWSAIGELAELISGSLRRVHYLTVAIQSSTARVLLPRAFRGVSWLGALAFIVGQSATALAQEQVVLFDVTYSHDATTTKDSHYVVKPTAETPKNWRSPIDFASAKVELYLEVLTKPSAEPTRYQLCFIGTPNYACTDQAPTYTAEGVVEWTSEFSRFYQYDQVDWAIAPREYTLILKDDKNGKPAPENVGNERAAQYLPSELRFVATLVPNGATYTRPVNKVAPPEPPLPDAMEDAGVTDPEAAGGANTGPESTPPPAPSPLPTTEAQPPQVPEPAATEPVAAPEPVASAPAGPSNGAGGGCAVLQARSVPMGFWLPLLAVGVAFRRSRARG